jgi:hypothetical protein
MITSSHYQIYKVFHYLGMMLLFFGFGGIFTAKFSGFELNAKAKMMALTSHGLGLVLLIFAGFGMLAQLGIAGGIPYWIFIKLTIWMFFGVAIAIVKRKANWFVWTLLFLVGAMAPYVVLFRN